MCIRDSYALSVALFFVAERYRLPMFVPLCVTSAASLETALQALSQRAARLAPRTSASESRRASYLAPRTSARGSAVLAAALIAAAALTALPLRTDSGSFDDRLRLSKALMNRGDYGQAALVLEDAHRLQPEHTVAEFNLGMALAAQGRAQEGPVSYTHLTLPTSDLV